ncbi:unnamed protein product, partial [Tilletia caries]
MSASRTRIVCLPFGYFNEPSDSVLSSPARGILNTMSRSSESTTTSITRPTRATWANEAAQASNDPAAAANAREFASTQDKILEALNQQWSGESSEETLARAVRNPEIARIMNNPVMQNILQQAQTITRDSGDQNFGKAALSPTLPACGTITLNEECLSSVRSSVTAPNVDLRAGTLLDTLESDWGAHDDENGWGGDVDSSMTATGVDNDEDPELVAAAAVDDSLVPTMSQLETDWMRTDNEGVTARPEGLWLFELLLVWLNATFGISEHICGLLLTFIEAVLAQTTRQGEWMPTFRAKPQASVRLRRIRQSLWQGSLSVAYALCPVSTCWTPHILDNNTPSKCTQCDGPLLLGTDTSGEDDEEADADVPA